MSLRLGDTAPDFEAETTEGRIRFHDWLGDAWGVLFSHPKDFTPVCTTELGYMARIKPEFDKRNVKIVGLSVDSADDHSKWAQDIAQTQGPRPTTPSSAMRTSRFRNCTGCSRPRPGVTQGPALRPTTKPCATFSSSAQTRRSS